MADRICDNCMRRVPAGSEVCPQCGIRFENTNPGGALPNGWVLAGRYTIGRYIDIDGEGVNYSAIDANSLQRVNIKEFMPVTLCSARSETGDIKPKPGCEVLFKTTRLDFTELFTTLLRLGFVEGLVQVLDVVEENNTTYAVMEKVEGPTLAEYLTRREGPQDPARALSIMRPVMSGVDMMHASSLVHRGICPENIILETSGEAKLGGFATLALRQQGSELKAKLYPGYSAPEQYSASEFEGRYTDIYAIGAVLYRFVTGMPPPPASERKLQDLMRPARTLNKNIPAFLSFGMARALRILAAERIQNVPDLRLALAGENIPNSRGFLGLSRKQMIVGGVSIVAVILVIAAILLITLFSGSSGAGTTSSMPSSAQEPPSLTSGPQNNVVMPDFTGKRYEDVALNAYYQNLYPFAEPIMQYSNEVEKGRIISQTPLPGDVWDGSTPVALVVSDGREAFPMPDFVTTPTSSQNAINALIELGLTESQIEVEQVLNDGRYEPGEVIETLPAAGTDIRPGAETGPASVTAGKLVKLIVAEGVTTEPMPNLVGQNIIDAKAALDFIGVAYEVIPVPNPDGVMRNGVVQSTTPTQGNEIAVGATNVQVYVYEDFIMPTLAYAVGERPDVQLIPFLVAKGIPYTFAYTTTPDATLDGTIQKLEYTVGVPVTAATIVTIHVFTYQAPPPPLPTSSSAQ